jgi:hypothetical protein
LTAGGVDNDRRYTNGRRCPICGGRDGDPRGAERRCFGFLSRDGAFAHCSREEHAGSITKSEKSDTYGHRLVGSCACGSTHGDSDPPRSHTIVATYDYHDEDGKLLYQVVRFDPKDFRQRRRDAEHPDRWIWKLGDVRRVLYRLDRVLEADPDATIYVVEGEKDVHAFESLGLVATCNPQGAGKWASVTECAKVALRGRRITIIADKDEKGRKHAAEVASRLRDIAGEVRIFESPIGKDAADWVAAGATADDVELACANESPARFDESAGSERDNQPDEQHNLAEQHSKDSRPDASRPVPTRRRWWCAPELPAEILRYADVPWVSLTLGGEELVRVRHGGTVVVMGGSGSGKSSLVSGLLVEHAANVGPAIALSIELPADEMAGRIVGMRCDASWEEALRGLVRREFMEDALNLPRLWIIDRDNATLSTLEAAIEAAREEYANQPILVAVDYAQLVESKERDIRQQVADVFKQIDRLLRRQRVVGIAVSQMSRAAARLARDGERIGADAADGGAESAAIERFATFTLTIGAASEERSDGSRAVELSVGKGRMFGGDRVIPMTSWGRSGRWRVAGTAQVAAEVRDLRDTERAARYQQSLEHALLGAAMKAPAPVVREELAEMVQGKAKAKRSAIACLIGRGDLVEIAQRRPRSRSWLVWTPERAVGAELKLVRDMEDS